MDQAMYQLVSGYHYSHYVDLPLARAGAGQPLHAVLQVSYGVDRKVCEATRGIGFLLAMVQCCVVGGREEGQEQELEEGFWAEILERTCSVKSLEFGVTEIVNQEGDGEYVQEDNDGHDGDD